MAKTCGNCVYAKICKKAVGSWFSPKNIAYCEAYKDGTNYVEVVRCKDCKWWKEDMCTNVNGANCLVFNGDWFCGSGERKDNG